MTVSVKSSISMQAALSLNWNGLCSDPDPNQTKFPIKWLAKCLLWTFECNSTQLSVDVSTTASKSESSRENLSRITCHFHRFMMAVWHGFYCLLDISSLTFDTTKMMDLNENVCWCWFLLSSSFLFLMTLTFPRGKQHDRRFMSLQFMTEYIFELEIIFDFLMVRHILWNPRTNTSTASSS